VEDVTVRYRRSAFAVDSMREQGALGAPRTVNERYAPCAVPAGHQLKTPEQIEKMRAADLVVAAASEMGGMARVTTADLTRSPSR
jgi:hypothetical protein